MTKNFIEEKKEKMTIIDKSKFDVQKKRFARALEIIASGELSGHGFGGSICESIAQYAIESQEDRITREAREALEGKHKIQKNWELSDKQKKYIDGDISIDQFCDPSV